MAAIATGWQAGSRPEVDDVSMENAAKDELAPPSSLAPTTPLHCIMTIGEARARYMHIVREEQF